MAAFVLGLLSTVPIDDVSREAVDLVEVNHFYDERGRLVFDQVIFYDWSIDDARFQIRAWRLIKHSSQIPVFHWQDGCWHVFWQDGEQLRDVSARWQRETWTMYDPELLEREILPKEKRRELRRIQTAKKPANKQPCPRPAEPMLTPAIGMPQ